MSGRKVNYNVRTAKSVERRMVLNALKFIFKNVTKSYRRYIGFGSFYFADFKLFHRELDIDKMISIEGDHTAEQRVTFNKPYKCIEVKIGQSEKVLPKLDWNSPFIDLVWTDYDQSLSVNMFTDCEVIFSNIKANSVYLMTCRRRLDGFDSWEEVRREFSDLLPTDSNPKDFAYKNSSVLIKRMFEKMILKTIDSRNASLSEENKLIYKPLFFFSYNDGGADMISIGGMIADKDSNFENIKTSLSDLDFIVEDNKEYQIEPPNLTYKEVYYINSHLPNEKDQFKQEEQMKFIPESDRMNYQRLYKYLPTYMDVTY